MSECLQCGQCCRLKAEHNGDRIVLDLFCPCLNLTTMKCMVYDWRHTDRARELRGGRACVTVQAGRWKGLYPRHCPSVTYSMPAWTMDQVKRLKGEVWARLKNENDRQRELVEKEVQDGS